jgi:hypothetical protein
MTSCQIAKHFSKPQFSEPKGAWQVINNGKYGFGKFTPLESEQPIGYAVIVFDADGIRSVIRLHREEASANAVMHQQVAYPHVEFA